MMSILHLIYPVRNNAPLEFLTGFTAFSLLPSLFLFHTPCLRILFHDSELRTHHSELIFQSFPLLDDLSNYPKEVG
jgi:hypothetical protein